MAVTLGVAWLMWPIWLSPALQGPRGGRLVEWLVPAHPLLAANGVLHEALGNWTEQAGVAYHYTTLGENVPYSMPENVFACVIVHGLIGIVGIGIALIPRRKGRCAGNGWESEPPMSF